MTASGTTYDERLRVPLRWWALATMFLASLLVAFLVAVPAPVAVIAVGLIAGFTVVVFLTYGGARVSVADGRFVAGSATIPVGLLAQPRALDADATRATSGVDADATAYLLLRPYVRGSVRVDVADPADPTPYWLVSTRHPEDVSRALSTAITNHTAR